MADRIQLRRDVATNWTTVNPTLAQGEFGYETDTNKLKFGDGTTVWSSLAYFSLSIDNITGFTDNSASWDTAYSWGDHALAGYATTAAVTAAGYATETYVDTAVSTLVDTAPAALDTLNELAAALGDDPNFATTVTNNIATKVSKTGDTMTGDLTVTNVITAGLVDGRDVSVDGAKLDGIEAGADVTDAVNVEPLVDSHLNVSTAAVGQVLSWDGADYDWVVAGGAVGGAVGTVTGSDVDLSTGTVFADAPSSNVTYTFSNPPAAGTGYNFTLRILGGEDATSYDIANTVEDGVTFDAGVQEAVPYGFAFNGDGTKMYVVGFNSNEVFQYSLSSPFDISAVSYDGVSLSVVAQDTSCRALTFNTDGTRLFVVGTTNDNVYQYTLSTGFDISTASFAASFSVAAQETAAQSIDFSADGTRMFIVGPVSDAVHQYTLSTGFDVSTASYGASFSVAAQELEPYAVRFSVDGTRMFIVGRDLGDRLREYTLTTAFDVSTASYSSISFYMYPTVSRGADVRFSADGKKMFLLDIVGGTVHQYTVSVSNTVFTFDYPASVVWDGGTAPLDPTPGVTDILEFSTDDGGATYYGALVYSTDSSKAVARVSDLATVATTGSYTDLLNLPALSTVATTGSYNDLSNLPTLAGDNPTFASVSVTGSITENVYAISGTAAAIDPANGTIQTHTLTGATIYTDSVASGQSVTLVIPGTANTVTWPTIKWLGGAAPTLDATNDTIISVFKIGTTLYGSSLGVFS